MAELICALTRCYLAGFLQQLVEGGLRISGMTSRSAGRPALPLRFGVEISHHILNAKKSNYLVPVLRGVELGPGRLEAKPA